MASDPKSNRTLRLTIWGVVVILLILALFSIRSLTREHLYVYVANAAYGDLTKTSSTNGKVNPVDDFQAHAPIAGQVQQIFVDVGQKVKPSQLLLRMQDADALARLASANSELQAAELASHDIEQGGTQDERNGFAADLAKARLQRQRDAASLASLQKLQQQGAAAPSEIVAAQQQLQIDDTNLQSIQQHSTQRYGDADRDRAHAQLTNARAAVAAAKSSFDDTDIRSPIAGTVYDLPVARYDYVDAGVDLIWVADLGHLKVTAYFDEPEVGNLAAGQKVDITWEAEPGKVWHGHVSQAPTTIISYPPRNVGECFITVDDPDGVLQPHANVTVTVTIATHYHVLTVPREALHFEDSQYYVFRVIRDKLVRTPVKVDIVNNSYAEITSGLAEGDTVALNATTNRDLVNGIEVHPIEK